MSELIRDNVAAKEAEFHATYDERLRNFEERCVCQFGRMVSS